MLKSEQQDVWQLQPEEFITANSELLSEGIRTNFSKSYFDEDDIQESLNRELKFMGVILASYELWAQEPNNVVLWDVDDTMGKAKFLNETSTPEWFFRPSMQLLIPYISKRYPTIKNGIISNRRVDEARYGFDKYSELFDEYPFFDPNYIFSCRDEPTDKAAAKAISQELFALYPGRTSRDAEKKLLILRQLAATRHDIKWRVIDDMVEASAMGESGADVYYLMPLF